MPTLRSSRHTLQVSMLKVFLFLTDWQCVAVTNTLSYYTASLVAILKWFMVSTLDVNFMFYDKIHSHEEVFQNIQAFKMKRFSKTICDLFRLTNNMHVK